jgi:hypothetical protein
MGHGLKGRAVAQADSRRLLTAACSNPGQVIWDLWWSKWHCGRFSPSTSVSAVTHSTDCSTLIITCIIRGWYKRPNGGRRTKWTQPHHTPKRKNLFSSRIGHNWSQACNFSLNFYSPFRSNLQLNPATYQQVSLLVEYPLLYVELISLSSISKLAFPNIIQAVSISLTYLKREFKCNKK